VHAYDPHAPKETIRQNKKICMVPRASYSKLESDASEPKQGEEMVALSFSGYKLKLSPRILSF
jgi:hypothetical protein